MTINPPPEKFVRYIAAVGWAAGDKTLALKFAKHWWNDPEINNAIRDKTSKLMNQDAERWVAKELKYWRGK